MRLAVSSGGQERIWRSRMALAGWSRRMALYAKSCRRVSVPGTWVI